MEGALRRENPPDNSRGGSPSKQERPPGGCRILRIGATADTSPVVVQAGRGAATLRPATITREG